MEKKSIWDLIFRKQPIERANDGISAVVAEAVQLHRESVSRFERAVQDLLSDRERLAVENQQLRRTMPRPMQRANGRHN